MSRKLPMTCPLTAEQIINEDYVSTDSCVIEEIENKVIDVWRWGTVRRIILRYDCEWVGVTYRVHTMDGFQGDSVEGPYPVRLEEKTVILYHRDD